MKAKNRRLLEELVALIEGRPVSPVRVELHPTDECNHACIWCVALPERKKGAQMPGERLVGLIDELAEAGVMEILFSGGGDPLVHPHIGEAIMRASKLGMAVEVITNGGGMTDKLAAIMLKHCGVIRFSLDAGTKAAHAAIHRPQGGPADRFETIIRRIEELAAHRQPRPRIVTSFVLHAKSVDSLREYLDLSRRIGVDHADIKYNFFAHGDEAQRLYQRADEVVEAYRIEYPDFSIGYDRFVYRRGLSPTSQEADIPWPYLHFAASIDAAGNIWPCCHLTGYAPMLEGNILTASFRDVWFGAERQQHLSAIERSPDRCRVCIHKSPNQTLIKAIEAVRRRKGTSA